MRNTGPGACRSTRPLPQTPASNSFNERRRSTPLSQAPVWLESLGRLFAKATPRPKVITFDCYGTLIDWESGIGAWFEGAAAEEGIVLARSELLAAYAEIEPAVEAEFFRPYREVLAETALRVAKHFDWALTPERSRGLADSLPSWKPFSDTNAALERLLASGYRLGILSNVDDDLLAGTLRHLNVPFELLVTAQQVRSYKPSPGHFETARRRIGESRWLHAAQSHFHDVVPCRALGIPVAWVNRKAQLGHAETRPDLEVRTLAGLADALGAGSV
jgi:2-haloacid dehalogenase/putative hydrolase of the HAD superfamily